LTESSAGSDFMLDVIKTLDIEYLAANPGTSFRGLHESVINYGHNKMPEFLTCMHEEASVAMAHGYSKVAYKPMMVCAHGTVGLQHASMALYNAWCDRVPIYMMVGDSLNTVTRGGTVEWAHSAQDPAALVRDFTKWDDAPRSLQHYAESAVRAYKLTMTPPMEPVVLVLDIDLQEQPIPSGSNLSIPKLPDTSPPQGATDAVDEAAKLLVNAESPVIVADRCARTAAGMAGLIELAEVLQCAVVDQESRLNFPTRHPLNQTNRAHGTIAQADVILGLELTDFYNTINSFHDSVYRHATRFARRNAKTIHITSTDLYLKSNYQDFERFTPVDLAITGDAEATLPSLTEAVRKLVDDNKKSAFAERGKKLAYTHQAALTNARNAAAIAWDASPISTARLCMDLNHVLQGEDWCLASEAQRVGAWPMRLWTMDKPYHYLGSSGGFGIGYIAPASVGAAVANRKFGRITVSIQPDGDLMYSPGVLWTAAHHRLPVLFVMHNNRAYHQEIMGIQVLADRRQRGVDRTHIGVTINDPDISYAKVAQGLGLYAEGPITDPNDLIPALQRALAVVKRGEPALVDVVAQPR
jgi:acetolactate synthase I/II/III large subunit